MNDLDNVIKKRQEERKPFLRGRNLLKTFGHTTAVNNIDIDIHKGEVLALIGANGAGKSTLTNLLSGVIASDHGALTIGDEEINLNKYSSAEARQKGIRVVHQELSLCKNLTVYENFYIEHYQKLGKRSLNWRSQVKKITKQALDKVFSGNGIDINAGLATLSIAQQQMVEIARAISDPDAKILILDEPTSSLPAEQTTQLQEYIRNHVKDGITYVYISHRLHEIMNLATRVYIMQNGREKYQCPISETNIEDMVLRMGDGILGETGKNTEQSVPPHLNPNVYVKLDKYSTDKLKSIDNQMFGGEVIALTGLEGNGQSELLQEIFFQAGKKKHGLEITGKVAYVAGDRKKEGIFPLWSISDNTIISKIAGRFLFRILSADFVKSLVEKWNTRLKTKCESHQDLITSLSGGNQQKVLIARAMAVDADIILLDDPTKGVDVATKIELYEIFREASNEGKLVIWRTSDDTELEYCTKLFVMNSGAIAGEFSRNELEHSSVLRLSFQKKDKKEKEAENKVTRKSKLFLYSLLSTIILYSLCGFLSPAVFTKFGFELLAVGFAPFIFAALAQTFIIGLGHIDLGIGAFMGLINVVCSTVLDKHPGLGILFLAALLLLYSSMGLFVCWVNIPSIIVTLSMSFVWIGTAYVLQDVPGGHAPEVIINIFNFDNPVLQGIIVWLIIIIIVSILIYRSRYGTVLRGFGNNETAMRNSGWSKAKAYWVTYVIAGCYAFMGGIAQSAITGASDINASATYTILTVTAVIIGGGYFSGGVVTHLGAVFGGISLTLISVLLGLFRVSTDFTATIQGLVLILILSFRLFRKEKLK